MKATKKTAELEKQQLERLREQMDKCVVKAPPDGIVIYYNRRYWDESSRIRPGANVYFQQPIFTLPDLDDMQVKLKVHESVVKKVQKEHDRDHDRSRPCPGRCCTARSSRSPPWPRTSAAGAAG